jgi:hypothetical protein
VQQYCLFCDSLLFRNVLKVILNPGDLKSFALCEKLCQAITARNAAHHENTTLQNESTS